MKKPFGPKELYLVDHWYTNITPSVVLFFLPIFEIYVLPSSYRAINYFSNKLKATFMTQNQIYNF